MSVVGGIIVGLAAAVSAIVSAVSSSEASEDTSASEAKSLRLANIQRQDALQRQNTEAGLSRERLMLDRAGLGLSAMQANRQFQFARQQYKDTKEAAERQEKRQSTQNALNNIMGFINSNESLKNQVINRMGA